MRLFDVEHPFLVPLWRRIAVVLVCLAWSAVEWATGASFWGVIASGFALYSIWTLLVRFDLARARGDAPGEDRGEARGEE